MKSGTGQHRPSWDQYFMEITKLVATRSTCLRRKVGAVFVKEKRILSTGYNGAPRGLSHCLEVGCMREQQNIPSGERHELCRGIHAEQNAIIQASTSGVDISGAILYTTHHPCSLCLKMLLNVSVDRIIFLEGYPDELSRILAEEGQLRLIQFENSEGCDT